MTSRFRILAWRIPKAEEPGGLQSTGSMHREPLKCLSGQAMGSNVHFRKIALATRAWKEEHFGKGHKWMS